jgi:hypothetical protein
MSADTEYVCETVRVTGVEPHPNADRLELVRFETTDGPSAYQVVCGKGEFRPGAPAVYLSVDCVVPVGGDPRTEFLFKLQGSVGRKTHRIRAVRLRGVYSEGLLIPDDGALPLGTDVAERLGVTYYRAPEPGQPSQPGERTSTVDHTLGGQFPVYGVFSLKKVPDLFHPGEHVLITEKIHGANMRAGWIDGRLVVGSHRVIKTDVRSWWRRLSDWLHGVRRGPGFYGTDVWSTAARVHQLGEKLRRFPGVVCYFELYGLTDSGSRIQDLTYGDPVLGLTLIDARAPNGEWLSWPELGELSERIGVDRVPVLEYVDWRGLDAHRALAEGQSELAPDQIREGFVARTLYDGRRGKLVGQGYLLRDGAK